MWKAVCCEVQGRGHIKTGIPCQDKTKNLNRNGVNVITLADGAGSAKLSHHGAECVVESMSAYIVDNFKKIIENNDGKQVKLDILNDLKQVLDKKSIDLNCRLNDLASTLLLVAVCEEKFLIIHIGDGVIGYLDGEQLKIASSPDNGEFANVTTFTTSNEALASMRLIKGDIKNISGFVIMSDGTEQSLYHKPSKSLAQAIVKLMHRTCLISYDVMRSQLIDSFNSIIIQNTQDDCSIAIMARPFGILAPFEKLSFDERSALFKININCRCIRKRISRYEDMIELLSTPKTCKQVSLEIHIKPKYVKHHLDKLISLGFITKQGVWYLKN